MIRVDDRLTAAAIFVLAMVLALTGPSGERLSQIGADLTDEEHGESVQVDVVEAVEPLSLQLLAPRDAICGDWVHVAVDASGAPYRYHWSAERLSDSDDAVSSAAVQGGLMVLDGGQRAVFSSRDEGVYRVTVSASSLDGQVTHAVVAFELLSKPSADAITSANIGTSRQIVTVADLAAGWYASVPNETKGDERIQLTTIMRELSALYRSGGASAADDPLRMIQKMFEEAIGPGAYSGWNSFFDGKGYLRDYLADLQSRGALESPEQWSAVLDDLAGVIDSLQ